MNDFFSAIILGIVEGLTEFLPISSTGHLILVNQFIGFQGNFENMFNIVIQLGAILSVIVYFRKRLIPYGANQEPAQKQAIWNLWAKTLVAVVPALILGKLFGEGIELWLFNPVTVVIMLVIGGGFLIFIENRKQEARIKTVKDLTFRLALAIGLIQCLAMIPGTSRSAATIIGAMLLGVSRGAAAEFSFFLAIPTMIAASGYSLLKSGVNMNAHEWQVLAVGFIVSFLVAWGVIAVFMNYITKKDFKPFGYYRIILGVLVLLYFCLR